MMRFIAGVLEKCLSQKKSALASNFLQRSCIVILIRAIVLLQDPFGRLGFVSHCHSGTKDIGAPKNCRGILSVHLGCLTLLVFFVSRALMTPLRRWTCNMPNGPTTNECQCCWLGFYQTRSELFYWRRLCKLEHDRSPGRMHKALPPHMSRQSCARLGHFLDAGDRAFIFQASARFP